MRPLPDHREADGDRSELGYARVPLSLLHSGFQDLGVLIWAQLRLWADGNPQKATYVGLAAALGQNSSALTTIEHKFSNAIRPLLGSWIHRTRVGPNLFAYQAVLPDPKERYALIRRSDIGLMKTTKQANGQAKAADIVDFARWQLECGARGWTVEPVAMIAKRWKVTPSTIRASRKRLEGLGLLEVVHREGPGRLPELVWLKEVYDPHWEIPSTRAPRRPATPRRSSRKPTVEARNDRWQPRQKTDSGDVEEPTADTQENRQSFSIRISSRESIQVSVVRGARPLTSATREVDDAAPAASRARDQTLKLRGSDAKQASARIVSRYPVFVRAEPHFRRAVIARLADALETGLAPVTRTER